MNSFNIKQGDTSPALRVQLQNENEQSVDIRGYNRLSFYLKKEDSDTLKIDLDDSDPKVIVEDPESGIVRYEWLRKDTNTTGVYKAEFEVEYANGSIESFPNTGNITIYINEDI